jgi:integrase
MPNLVLTELRLYLSADLPAVGRPPEPDDYLIYPIDRRAVGRGQEGQVIWERIGRPKDSISMPAIHRWWYRMAQEAGLVSQGTTSGLNMHQARHAFAMELRRVAGVEAASQALGHSDLSTTLGIYGHQDETDLEQAMEIYNRYLEEQGL